MKEYTLEINVNDEYRSRVTIHANDALCVDGNTIVADGVKIEFDGEIECGSFIELK